MTIPPLEEGLEPIHDRTYTVNVFRRNDHEIVARGIVHDVKPAGLYVEGDPDPLTIHEMVLDLVVGYPSLEITDANVVFESHPQSGCPAIADHYGSLVGLSIARGFTRNVRDLFGGPNGCTHVTALLQAMAPVLVQSTWSMRVLARREQPVDDSWRSNQNRNIDTCHVWAADGEMMGKLERGEVVGPGIPVRDRLLALGKDPADWATGG